jgi:hypothetical protein
MVVAKTSNVVEQATDEWEGLLYVDNDKKLQKTLLY